MSRSPEPNPNPEMPPVEQMTALQEGAVQIHELYRSYRSAGFTKDEALTIIIGLISSSKPNEDDAT